MMMIIMINNRHMHYMCRKRIIRKVYRVQVSVYECQYMLIILYIRSDSIAIRHDKKTQPSTKNDIQAACNISRFDRPPSREIEIFTFTTLYDNTMLLWCLSISPFFLFSALSLFFSQIKAIYIFVRLNRLIYDELQVTLPPCFCLLLPKPKTMFLRTSTIFEYFRVYKLLQGNNVIFRAHDEIISFNHVFPANQSNGNVQ